MPRHIEFWFDFASTYSYPAAMRISALADAANTIVHWHPFLLGPTFAAQGWSDSPFNLQALKGSYMWRDLERVCTAAGIRWRRPTQFPRNGLLAARIACRNSAAAWVPDFCRAVFQANFADDRDISEPRVIQAILDSIGQSGSTLIAETQTPEVKAMLRAQVDKAQILGLFGAPSFRAGTELFWGNDRLEQALAWASHPPHGQG